MFLCPRTLSHSLLLCKDNLHLPAETKIILLKGNVIVVGFQEPAQLYIQQCFKGFQVKGDRSQLKLKKRKRNGCLKINHCFRYCLLFIIPFIYLTDSIYLHPSPPSYLMDHFAKNVANY